MEITPFFQLLPKNNYTFIHHIKELLYFLCLLNHKKKKLHIFCLPHHRKKHTYIHLITEINNFFYSLNQRNKSTSFVRLIMEMTTLLFLQIRWHRFWQLISTTKIWRFGNSSSSFSFSSLLFSSLLFSSLPPLFFAFIVKPKS